LRAFPSRRSSDLAFAGSGDGGGQLQRGEHADLHGRGADAGELRWQLHVREDVSSVDTCGNTGTAAQTITVQDTVGPVVTAPGAVTIACTDSHDPAQTPSLG